MSKALNTIVPLALLLVSSSAVASMAAIECADDSAAGLTPSVSCQYIHHEQRPNGVANPDASDLNDLALFGIDSWILLGKQEAGDSGFSADGSNDYSLSLGEGSWSFSTQAWEDFSTIALVMKDGNNAVNTPSGGVYAYQVTDQTSSGTWSTDEPFGGADLSHMAGYGTTSVAVPGPGALGLLATGLLGFVWRARQASRPSTRRRPTSQSISTPVV